MSDIRYKIEDLYVGMKGVKFEELHSIYNYWIYFKDYSPETGGEIIAISDKPNSELVKKCTINHKLSVYYIPYEEGIDYIG